MAAEVKACLAERLAAVPGAVGLVARLDGSPAGVATAFPGFSTFAARPLLNIHDLAVLAPFRRQGIGQALLAELEQIAMEQGCCKLTLEVLSHNQVVGSNNRAWPCWLGIKANKASSWLMLQPLSSCATRIWAPEGRWLGAEVVVSA